MIDETVDNEELKSIGGTLLLARTEIGLSQEDIAKKLRLSKTFVQYLENDEFERLGQRPVFIRGYVRAYARLVNIPEETIVRLLDMSNIKDMDLTNKKIFLSTKKQVSVRDKKIRYLTYAIIILFLILIFIWWHSHVNQRHRKVTLTTSTTKQPIVSTAEADKDKIQPPTTMVKPDRPEPKKIATKQNASEVTNKLHMDYNG